MPHIPITLFTDEPTELTSRELFDEVRKIENPRYSFADKIRPIMDTPYKQTLYLDADTYVARDCEEIFAPLDRWDVAVCHSAERTDYSWEELPQSMPTFNTGVIGYSMNDRVRGFLKAWNDLYEQDFAQRAPADQPAFRYCAYREPIRLFVLPTEYNLHVMYPCFVGGAAEVKILHDHNSYLAAIAHALNGRRGLRPVIYGPMEPELFLQWAWMKLRKVGRRFVQEITTGSP